MEHYGLGHRRLWATKPVETTGWPDVLHFRLLCKRNKFGFRLHDYPDSCVFGQCVIFSTGCDFFLRLKRLVNCRKQQRLSFKFERYFSSPRSATFHRIITASRMYLCSTGFLGVFKGWRMHWVPPGHRNLWTKNASVDRALMTAAWSTSFRCGFTLKLRVVGRFQSSCVEYIRYHQTSSCDFSPERFTLFPGIHILAWSVALIPWD